MENFPVSKKSMQVRVEGETVSVEASRFRLQDGALIFENTIIPVDFATRIDLIQVEHVVTFAPGAWAWVRPQKSS